MIPTINVLQTATRVAWVIEDRLVQVSLLSLRLGGGWYFRQRKEMIEPRCLDGKRESPTRRQELWRQL